MLTYFTLKKGRKRLEYSKEFPFYDRRKCIYENYGLLHSVKITCTRSQHIRNSLQELADVLYCSTKNVKILLKKMSEEQLISWTRDEDAEIKQKFYFHILS